MIKKWEMQVAQEGTDILILKIFKFNYGTHFSPIKVPLYLRPRYVPGWSPPGSEPRYTAKQEGGKQEESCPRQIDYIDQIDQTSENDKMITWIWSSFYKSLKGITSETEAEFLRSSARKLLK